jgi:hypothetical protein
MRTISQLSNVELNEQQYRIILEAYKVRELNIPE